MEKKAEAVETIATTIVIIIAITIAIIIVITIAIATPTMENPLGRTPNQPMEAMQTINHLPTTIAITMEDCKVSKPTYKSRLSSSLLRSLHRSIIITTLSLIVTQTLAITLRTVIITTMVAILLIL